MKETHLFTALKTRQLQKKFTQALYDLHASETAIVSALSGGVRYLQRCFSDNIAKKEKLKITAKKKRLVSI